MSKIVFGSLGLLLFGLLAACNSSKSATMEEATGSVSADSLAMSKMAVELLGEEALIDESDGGEYVLAYKITPSNQYNPYDRVSFAIVETASKEIVHQRNDYSGTIKWFDNYRLELIPSVGMVRANDDSSAGQFRLLLSAKTGLMEEAQVSK